MATGPDDQQHGTNYNVMLQNADMIIAWDYFSLAGYPASYSQNVGQYLATFGLNRAILSVGLWGSTTPPLRQLISKRASWLPRRVECRMSGSVRLHDDRGALAGAE